MEKRIPWVGNVVWHSLGAIIPLGLILCEDLPLGVVADHLDVDKTTKV